MDYPFNTNQTDEQLPVPQNNPEQTSNQEHAPLPIGCNALSKEEQRCWDNFCRQGKERDRKLEEKRQQWKEMQEKEKKQDAGTIKKEPTPEPKQDTPKMSMMDIYMRNISYRSAPVVKKFNLPAQEIETYLLNAYTKECADRNYKTEYDTGTRYAIENVSRWLSAESHTKGSLILRGYVGVGKTTMLLALRRLFIGFGLGGFRIVSAFELAEVAKDKEAFQRLKSADFLGIDDLGQEPTTIKDWGNERNPFEELISARYDRLRQTFISTNLVVVNGADQITERYGTRVADRLKEMCNTINYDPKQKSYRQ